MTPRLWSDGDNGLSALGNNGQRGSHSENSQMSPFPHLRSEASNARPGANLYALTIGINEYKSSNYHNLKGCLADADGIKKYLQMELSVPLSNIKSLRNSEATRAAILKELISFVTNPNIQFNDPILIYFAGHGTAVKSPTEWASNFHNSKTQMLIPHDCGEKVNGNDVHGIPDRTLGWILRGLADEKGNNITVILDNCFSGSGTRGAQPMDSLLRGVKYHLQLPVNLDAEYAYKVQEPRGFSQSTRRLNVVPGFQNSGFKSHILISACGAGEEARETSRHGIFTEALLKALRSAHGFAMETLTYNDLLKLIERFTDQNPQCEGDNQDRRIFDAKMAYRRRITYTGSVKANILSLDAGHADGITRGSKLSIWKNYESYLREERPVAEALVSKVVDNYNSEVTWASSSRFLHGHSFIAELVSLGDRPDLKIHVRGEGCSQLVGDAITQTKNNAMKPILSPVEQEATVIISPERDSDGIYFEIIDPDINRHGFKRLPHTAPAEVIALRRIIPGISHYQYHLRFPKIQDSDERAFFAREVSLGVFKAKVLDSDGSVSTVGNNLNVDGKGIDLEIDESPLAIVVHNNTNFDMFPALFYFDSTDLSITEIYLPPTAGHNKVDPPLQAHQRLTVGYSDQGGVPHIFENRGSLIELGFLKLYIMSRAVDLSNLPQKSPFENTRATGVYVEPKFDFLHAFVVPVVVRNNPRTRQGHTSRSLSNATPRTEFVSTSYPSPPLSPPVKRGIRYSALDTSRTAAITVKLGVSRMSIPNSSPPGLLARLNASASRLKTIDQDLKAIEKTQKEGVEERKRLERRIANVGLEITG